ncbi:hypothetical protein PTTG_26330 [Puccinia triticina 1-1 BBBD Race 1]|uniref:CxC1 domain-containing protein n=1 Tax=Puccinia triticina (isolate 1-1 / race 1 (BBBD)) TaxID=630390 RepID=A0A180GVZ6_PUCT1|nr:hypothetical protein PTTG_26330 [Puccinia triticina 1-1 BBBD Race 1]
MTRPVQRTNNQINASISTGSTRSRRKRRRPTEYDIAEQHRFEESIRSGRRAGVIPAPSQHPTHPLTSALLGTNENSDWEETIDEYEEDNQQRNQRDPMLQEHAAYHCLRRHAERREQISHEWSQLEAQAASTYLLQQESTLNFTCNTMDEFTVPSGSCACAPGDIHHRHVDLIDIIYQQPRRSIPFCKCIPNVIRLLHYGYFAASANTPRTAFSVRLIQLHHFIWKPSVISTSAFVKGLSAFLDTRSTQPLLSRSVHFRKRNLCIPFSYSVDLHSRIMTLQKKLVSDGLQLSAADDWADKCPRCFGPSVNEIKADPNEPDFIIALDGNFQQRHYAHASKDNP